MGRSVLAVVVGFLLIGALAIGADSVFRLLQPEHFNPDGGSTDPATLLIIIGYVFVFATFGCYVTGRLAHYAPLRHALVLGSLGLIFNVIATISLWHTAPAWYHITALLLVMPAAYLGGKLAERRRVRVAAIP